MKHQVPIEKMRLKPRSEGASKQVLANNQASEPEAEFYPEPATPWFCFDPEGGFTYHASPELAEQAADKKISDYIDHATQSWRPGVESICTGLVLTHSEQTNVVPVAKHPVEHPLDLGAVGSYEIINIHRRG